jgi:hypothetical protein
MRCVLRLTIVLLLVVDATAAFSESFVCHTIRRGESAALAARRLTGDGRNAYQPWFQIRNASSRSVPKSQYDRIRGGWRACFIKSAIPRASLNTARLQASIAPDVSDVPTVIALPDATAPLDAVAAPASLAIEQPLAVAESGARSAASDIRSVVERFDLTMVWLGAAMVVPWVGWRVLDDYLARRKTNSIVMRHFAERFISEFERPLVRPRAGERSVRSRIRFSARPRRFDILLAPGTGRRYPNLTDHKKNVEYDVARVLTLLADRSFVCGALYTDEGWVVVPFQFLVGRSLGGGRRAGPKHTGVTCISSF